MWDAVLDLLRTGETGKSISPGFQPDPLLPCPGKVLATEKLAMLVKEKKKKASCAGEHINGDSGQPPEEWCYRRSL